MSKKFECPHCRKVLTLPDTFSSPNGKCPFCKQIFQITHEPAAPPPPPRPAHGPGVHACPHCLQALRVPPHALGQRIACPHCQAPIAVMGEPASLILAPDVAESEVNIVGLGVVDVSVARKRAAVSGSGNSRYEQAPAASPRAGQSHRSRFAAAPSSKQAVAAECVVHRFLCEERPEVGAMIADATVALLKDEECFRSVVAVENTDTFGSKVTVNSGFASLGEVKGGFVQKASSTLITSASLVMGADVDKPFSARSQFAGGNLNEMTKQNVQMASQAIVSEIVKLCTGRNYLAGNIKSNATASCVCGCLSFIPGLGYVSFVIALVLAIIVWVRNASRVKKIGATRVTVGLIIGVIGLILSTLLMLSE